ncbi:MAG: hypothetical protein R3242_03620 [Akkermansiaceae bacterium]|nr:hypothetical protein [Akkermansiaceae bacterium]
MKLDLVGEWELIATSRDLSGDGTMFPLGSRFIFSDNGDYTIRGVAKHCLRMRYSFEPKTMELTLIYRTGETQNIKASVKESVDGEMIVALEDPRGSIEEIKRSHTHN